MTLSRRSRGLCTLIVSLALLVVAMHLGEDPDACPMGYTAADTADGVKPPPGHAALIKKQKRASCPLGFSSGSENESIAEASISDDASGSGARCAQLLRAHNFSAAATCYQVFRAQSRGNHDQDGADSGRGVGLDAKAVTANPNDAAREALSIAAAAATKLSIARASEMPVDVAQDMAQQLDDSERILALLDHADGHCGANAKIDADTGADAGGRDGANAAAGHEGRCADRARAFRAIAAASISLLGVGDGARPEEWEWRQGSSRMSASASALPSRDLNVSALAALERVVAIGRALLQGGADEALDGELPVAPVRPMAPVVPVPVSEVLGRVVGAMRNNEAAEMVAEALVARAELLLLLPSAANTGVENVAGAERALGEANGVLRGSLFADGSIAGASPMPASTAAVRRRPLAFALLAHVSCALRRAHARRKPGGEEIAGAHGEQDGQNEAVGHIASLVRRIARDLDGVEGMTNELNAKAMAGIRRALGRLARLTAREWAETDRRSDLRDLMHDVAAVARRNDVVQTPMLNQEL